MSKKIKSEQCDKCNNPIYGGAKYCVCGGRPQFFNKDMDNIDEMFERLFGIDRKGKK